MKRRFRAKATGGIVSLAIFVAAMHGCQRAYEDWKSPYRLTHYKEQYFLEEKRSARKEPITQDFQLGSIEYRIEGLLREGKDRVEQALKHMKYE